MSSKADSTHLVTALLAIQPHAMLVDAEGTIIGGGDLLPDPLQSAVGRALAEVLRPLGHPGSTEEYWELLDATGTVLAGLTHPLPDGGRALVLQDHIRSDAERGGAGTPSTHHPEHERALQGGTRPRPPATENGHVSTCTNITDPHRPEGEHQDAVRTRKLFLAHVCHELRTPMNVVLGLCDALIRHEQRPEQLDQLRSVHQATRNLLAITNDLLQFSRTASSDLALHPKPHSLWQLVEHIERLFQPQARSKGIDLRTTIDTALQGMHLIDGQRLDQVLMNLVGNAIKFTPQGQVVIAVKAGPVHEDVQRVVITVQDTGAGMSPSYQEHLFEPFSRDPLLHGAEIEGSGLGLGICKHLVDLMQGSIQVDSAPDRGTVVEVGFDLPVAAENPAHQLRAQEAPDITLPSATVLLADDSAFNRKVVAAMLQGQPIELIEAEHGAAALELLCKRKVDLVLMDLRMPVMDGHDLLKLLRGTLRDHVPVLMLTAGDTTPEQEGMTDALGSRTLRKPHERRDLLHYMRELLSPSADEDSAPAGTAAVASRWDRSTLASMVGNDPSLMNKIMAVFSQEAPRTLDQLEQAACARDVATMGALAHRLSPSLRMLGINDARGVIDELIANGRNSTGHERGPGLVAVIRRVVEEALADIDQP